MPLVITPIPIISPTTRKPIQGMTSVTIRTSPTMIRKNAPDDIVSTILYYMGDPIIIYTSSVPYRNGFRLASDKASALQMRRMKRFLSGKSDVMSELSPEDMNSKVNEILADAISKHLDAILKES